MLKWQSIEDSHIIMLQQGKAVISEKQHGTKTIYLLHIEDKEGISISSFEPGFEDFETADVFVSANLIELDRVGIDETKFRSKLTATLDYCISLLSEPNRVFHRRRLESIKRWLTHNPANYTTDDLPQNDWENRIFDWHQTNNLNMVGVPPHGKAFITEEVLDSHSHLIFGSGINYSVQIEDSTGITLDDPYHFSGKDLVTAESRLRQILTELENPFVDESYVDYLAFTLQICRHLLPPDADLMQYIRLNYIETYLGEVLP